MSCKNILLVRDGDFFIYIHQLAMLLREAGHQVSIFQSDFKAKESLYDDLFKEIVNEGIDCRSYQAPPPDIISRLMRKLRERVGMDPGSLRITRNKINELRRFEKGGQFDYIIGLDTPSVCLACRAFPDRYADIISYSLEVIEESHPAYQLNSDYRSMVEFERRALPRLGALMIQDRFREEAMVQAIKNYDRRKTIYYPVAWTGEPINVRPPGGEFEVLFFGGLWSQELLAGLKQASQQLPEGIKIVVRGGRTSLKLTPTTGDKFTIDTRSIPFNEIDHVISQSQIGIAIYPDPNKNCRTTAFSSEKIARYCKSGLPFIAFDNCDYRYLKSEINCCELIQGYDEIPAAIGKIVSKYDDYRKNAFNAFDRFYSLKNTSQAFLTWVENGRLH